MPHHCKVRTNYKLDLTFTTKQASQVLVVKNPPAKAGNVRVSGWEEPLEEAMAHIHQTNSPCVCMLSCSSHVQLFATIWTTTLQAPLSMGFSRQEYWSRLSCSPPRDLPYSGIKPMSPVPPAFQVDSLPTEPPGKPK